jgi:hypothetical protein
LAIVFLGTDGQINVNTSPDGLARDKNTKIPEERSALSPGLAFNPNGTTYLAWVSADRNINIMQTSSSGLIKWESRKRTVWTQQHWRLSRFQQWDVDCCVDEQ